MSLIRNQNFLEISFTHSSTATVQYSEKLLFFHVKCVRNKSIFVYIWLIACQMLVKQTHHTPHTHRQSYPYAGLPTILTYFPIKIGTYHLTSWASKCYDRSFGIYVYCCNAYFTPNNSHSVGIIIIILSISVLIRNY